MANGRQAVGSGTAAGQFTAHPRLRTLYLTLYNTLFAFLWAWIGLQTLTQYFQGSTKQELFIMVQPLVRWVQTLTLIEVAHAAIGLVNSPVSTTAIQIFTRVIQVWMIWWCFPGSTAASRAFPVLVLAWAAADSIRYLYLALNLHGRAPSVLLWLRYINENACTEDELTDVGIPCSSRYIPLESERSGG